MQFDHLLKKSLPPHQQEDFNFRWIKRVDSVDPSIGGIGCFRGLNIGHYESVAGIKSGIYLTYGQGYAFNESRTSREFSHIIFIFDVQKISKTEAQSRPFYFKTFPDDKSGQWLEATKKAIIDEITRLNQPQMEPVEEIHPVLTSSVLPSVAYLIESHPQPLSHHLIRAKFLKNLIVNKTQIENGFSLDIEKYRLEFAAYYRFDLKDVPRVIDDGGYFVFYAD